MKAESKTAQIQREIRKAVRDFGFADEREFVLEAIREKLLQLKKLKFFFITEKVKKGLQKRGVFPKRLLRELKT